MKPASLIQPTGKIAAAIAAVLVDSDGHQTPIHSNISWCPADDAPPASPLASCVLPSCVLSPLQARHAAAKAAAAALVKAHPGIISLYDLGEHIALIEDQSTQAFQRLDPATGLALHAVAQRLKSLIPRPF
jgi:hypothetical protein